MANFANVYSNDLHNHLDLFSATVFQTGTVTGTEGIVTLPYSGVDGNSAGNGWELVSVILSVGTNVTHTDGELTATVEKNSDGGTTALATVPSITNDAGTLARTTALAATGTTKAVVSATESARQFADGESAFVTLVTAGSGGTAASDLSATLTFKRLLDYEPLLTTART